MVIVGTLIDGSGRDPQRDFVVVARGERVVAVGPRAEVSIPDGARVVEIPGATILPGFINTHVHNAWSPAGLGVWAQAGVTTVRDLGQRPGSYSFSRRDRMRADPKNAWLLAAGPLVTVPGGYPIAGNNFPSLTVDSPDDARAKVGQLIREGADVVKITLVSGSIPSLSPDETRAIVETAQAAGVPVSVHATHYREVALAVDAGVDDIAHMAVDYVPDELMQKMIDQGTCWVPTLEALRGGGDNLRRFVALGGCVALGNDGGFLSGLEVGMPLEEMRAMLAAGMSPMQVIGAATRDAARVCRVESDLGTLEPGKVADLIVVQGDPLDSLEVLAEPRLVVHRGTIIRDER